MGTVQQKESIGGTAHHKLLKIGDYLGKTSAIKPKSFTKPEMKQKREVGNLEQGTGTLKRYFKGGRRVVLGENYELEVAG